MLISYRGKPLSGFVGLVLKALQQLGALVAHPCRLCKLGLEGTELSLGLLLLLNKSDSASFASFARLSSSCSRAASF